MTSTPEEPLSDQDMTTVPSGDPSQGLTGDADGTDGTAGGDASEGVHIVDSSDGGDADGTDASGMDADGTDADGADADGTDSDGTDGDALDGDATDQVDGDAS